MAQHWDIFRGGQTVPSSDRLGVSINNKNTLTLNKYTYTFLGRPAKVLVMFDKRDSVIGLSPTHADDPDGFDVKPKGGGLNFIIHITPFCRHHGIFIESTERFAKPGLTREGFLTLDLKETINVGNRRKRN
ncbi:MAG: hypothetical protein QUS14_16860 [Pyrinomonadaceae bacterium]|nr:hypothetical protein [Pyrinomonadaceae bacterium]